MIRIDKKKIIALGVVTIIKVKFSVTLKLK